MPQLLSHRVPPMRSPHPRRGSPTATPAESASRAKNNPIAVRVAWVRRANPPGRIE